MAVTLELFLLTAGGLVAGVVSGASGFGFALVATALWMQVLEPRVVAVLAVTFTFLMNVAYLPMFWRQIVLRRLLPLVAGSVVGVPLGVQLLTHLPSHVFRAMVGVVLLGYGITALRRKPRPPLVLAPRRALIADTAVGAAGGVLGGAGGLSGFLPAIWAPLRGWPKMEARAVVLAYILFTSLLTLFWFGGTIGLTGRALTSFWTALPFVGAGMWLGLKIFARLDGERFHRLVLWVLTFSGALLVLGFRR